MNSQQLSFINEQESNRESLPVYRGGFPCQPFSAAGKRRGKADDRYLWPEMLRVIQEIRPSWVIGENVSGLVRTALDEILESLEQAEYTARAYAFKASEVGTLFAGERIAIVATSNDRRTALRGNIQFPADDSTKRCQDNYRGGTQKFNPGKWRSLESRPYGVAHGVPHRVDRLRCLGNAVVPQQFYPIFKAIAEIERSLNYAEIY